MCQTGTIHPMMQKNQLKLYNEFSVIVTRIQINNHKRSLLLVQHSDNHKKVIVCREEYSCQGEALCLLGKKKSFMLLQHRFDT